MTIKKLDISCVDELSALENICFSDPWTKEQLEGSLISGTFFGAFENELMCGYAGFYIAADCCEILNICVSPDMRRKGLGKALLLKAEKEAIDKGCKGVYLELRKSNLQAKSLYVSNGYAFDCIRKNYYKNPEEDAVLMHKDIQ